MANVKEIVQDEKKAEAIESLQKLCEKTYDLSGHQAQLGLIEGLAELGKHIAATCSNASIKITYAANGVTGVIVDSVPKP